ncbi:oxidoreductase family protein [Annulohypoxylon maeteangense]|uniref:oxidoreductase family protein n=1 Tax=Annulohypoxylon maeteangense TaxID=1927788 RepID=UPI00200830B4|nr:oxidoreductase family protein [Annulohypoxylon maeteangense]KAI0881682.1 oxidoreductase family protein [Annulohypoxylon maeteangense]
MDRVGVAIIGGGIFVKEQHIPAALASPLLDIKAIWSRSRKTAEDAAKEIPSKAASSVDLYSTDSGEGKAYEDILKREDISGVILALPIVDQPSYIEKALAAGKHVLAEKPIAKDVATAVKLIEYYKKVSAETNASFAIAENFRFLQGWAYGAEQIKKLGKVTGFVVRLNSMMAKENKYYNTPWRTVPEYQGGFLLDGGVHFTAALRKLLGPENAVESLVANTALVSSHLPPVDSINAVLKTKSGVVGSYITSVGTTMDAFEFHVATEQGVVKAEGAKVVTTRGIGKDAIIEEKVFERSSGVKEEVHAWAESILSGIPNPNQTPELALGDLELMEKMLTSGDQDGARQKLVYQHFV